MPDCSCPRIDDSAWQDREHDWGGKSFYRRRTPMFMHVPFRIGKDIAAAADDAARRGHDLSRPLMVLSRDGLFRGEVLLGIEKPIADSDVIILPPTRVYSRIYEGKWRDIAKPTRELIKYLKGQGKIVQAVYYWYITCSVCSINRGYRTVIFAQFQ